MRTPLRECNSWVQLNSRSLQIEVFNVAVRNICRNRCRGPPCTHEGREYLLVDHRVPPVQLTVRAYPVNVFSVVDLRVAIENREENSLVKSVCEFQRTSVV